MRPYDDEQERIANMADDVTQSKYDEAWEANMKSFTDAWNANLKGVVDSWMSDFQQQAKQRQGQQDALNQLTLSHFKNLDALATQMISNSAAVSNRINNNAATLDILIGAGEVDTTAQGAMGAKIAQDVKDSVDQAIDQAVAAISQTNAATQGTTGVAQGGLQTGVSAVNTALIANLAEVVGSLGAQMAKIQSALDVLLVNTTGEAVKS